MKTPKTLQPGDKTMPKKRTLWHSALTKAEKRHLWGAGCNLVSIEPFRRTIASQNPRDCDECFLIAKKLGLVK